MAEMTRLLVFIKFAGSNNFESELNDSRVQRVYKAPTTVQYSTAQHSTVRQSKAKQSKAK